MDLKVNLFTMVNQALASTQKATDRMAQLQSEAASGKRLLLPSDGPADTVALLAAKWQDAKLGTYLSNIESATSTLNAGVSAMLQASDILVKARQIAIEGSQSTNSQQALDVMASQVDQLLSQLLATANAKDGARYLFSGASPSTQPFAVSSTNSQGQPTSVAYQGADDAAEVIVGPQRTAKTLYPGNDIFQSAQGGDAFQVLMALRDDLRNTAGMTSTNQLAAINSHIGELQNAQDAVLAKVGEQSATLENLQSVQSHFQDLQLAARKSATDLESADISDVVIQLQAQQNQLQLTLGAISKVLNINLLDFLK